MRFACSEETNLLTTKMLINTQRAEQVRVAIVDGTDLKDYQVQITDKNLCRGNIYRGVVANIQPSLGAAFIDMGEDRHGFLPVADVQPSAYHRQPPKSDAKRPRIDQVLERGKPILVQATKDGVGNKGAALSTNIALAGRYLVLTPFDAVSGISRKVEDEKARKTIRRRLDKLNIPDGHGVIVRTNGLEQNQTTLTRDLNALLRMWKKVQDEHHKGRGPRLLYSDQDLIVQALRDYLDASIAEVIVDADSAYDKARTYMRAFMPRSKTGLIRYQERLPLFTRYNVETQIDAIYDRRAPLPSGGSLVIDGTEALTAIDVNSGRATGRGNHDESILSVNIEAAAEVARQLRLRDIGGLVVVDFIDMRTRKHQAKLEKAMRDAMKVDKARYSVGRISPNGLLEINRQRIKQALHQRTHRPCPGCHGVGSIPSPEFAATTLLGRIEARVAPGLVEKVTVAAHPEIADALQNHHRAELTALETELQLTIEVISATNFRRTEDRIDYQQREKAVVPKVGPALTSSDLAGEEGNFDEPPHVGADGEDKPTKRPRKRRRRRKPSAKAQTSEAQAGKNGTAEPSDKAGAPATETPVAQTPTTEAAADEAPASEKPTRPRRRRRGGRRNRRKPEAVDAQAQPSQAPESSPTDLFDDGSDWNVAMSEPESNNAPTDETPPPKAKTRRPRKSTTRKKDSEKPAGAKPKRAPRKRAVAPETAAPTSDQDGWQFPVGAPSPSADAPSAPDTAATSRSPLRRDRSTLRWQWWGGDSDDPGAPSTPPNIVASPIVPETEDS